MSWITRAGLVAAVFMLAATARAGQPLRVCNWTNYLPASVLADFTRDTGIRVEYSTYEGNEELFARLRAPGGSGCDLVVPSTYAVQQLRDEGLLARLNKAGLKNLGNLDPELMAKPFDPGNDYSLPYLWGGTGILVDTTRVDPRLAASWADLWRPQFKGLLLLPDDPREVFGIALRTLGRSVNEKNPAVLDQAAKKLAALMPGVRAVDSADPKAVVLSGKAAVAAMWNGEAYQAQLENPLLEFVWPKEGGLLWMDCLAVPKDAARPAEAHAFMDYLLRPEVAARISLELGYATPNLAAQGHLPQALQYNWVVNPPRDVVQRSEFQEFVGRAAALYERHWADLRQRAMK